MIDETTAAPRLDRFAPVLAAGLAFAIALWASQPYAVGVFHDDGVYAVLAKSLATGQGYRYLHLPGAPSAVHYPPGYPLVLAALWRIAPDFPGNIAVFLLANAVLVALIAWGAHRFATRVLGWPSMWAAAATLFATATYPLLMLSGLVLSEPLFIAGLFPVLIVAERVARDDDRASQALLVGMAAGLLALVRTHGAAVAMALVLLLLVRRRWRSAVLCAAGVGITVAPWELWAASHAAGIAEPLRGSYGSYGAWLVEGARGGGAAFVTHTIAVNLRETGLLLADRFAVHDASPARWLSAWVAGLLIIGGAWRMARRAPVTVTFAVVYFAVLLAWPYTPWRFFFALWPVLLLFIGESAAFAFSKRSVASVPVRLVAVAMVGLIAIGSLREEWRSYANRAWRQPADAAATQIAPVIRWISTETVKTDVVAAEGEQLVYLFTGRRAVPLARFTASEYARQPTAAEGAEALRSIVAAFPVKYVLTISPPVLASANLLQQPSTAADSIGSRLVRVRALPGGGVFRVLRDSGLGTRESGVGTRDSGLETRRLGSNRP